MKRALILLVIVFILAGFNPIQAQMPYKCGDVNADFSVNLLDVLALIDYVYNEGPEPPVMMMADVNGDGEVNLLDILRYIDKLYVYPNPGLHCVVPHDDYQTGCLPEKDYGDDTMYVSVAGYDLHIHHDNAYYDCCLGYWTGNSIDMNHITVYQFDSIPECDCYCYFNLESVFHTEYAGSYVVTLIGLEGDTVGIDTAEVTGEEAFTHEETQSGCLEYAKDDPTDTVFFEVVGNDLHTFHRNAYYNCGLAYLVEYKVADFHIRATEADTGMPADCICYFNLKSVLYDLPDGEYTVTLVDVYGTEIAWDTIVVDGEYGLTGYEQSDCFEDPTGLIEYSYADGELTLKHHDAFYNCVAEMIIQFEQEGNVLRFYERNISEEAVYCLCYFELDATVEGIAPGEYIVEVWAQDYPYSPTVLIDERILILE
ncbi:MAG: hypothetical protein JW763_08900 [candidate division Zixibacteria bacterium]|nr:hypothetical protein [candidate division Zixibacteria bacterium]